MKVFIKSKFVDDIDEAIDGYIDARESCYYHKDITAAFEPITLYYQNKQAEFLNKWIADVQLYKNSKTRTYFFGRVRIDKNTTKHVIYMFIITDDEHKGKKPIFEKLDSGYSISCNENCTNFADWKKLPFGAQIFFHHYVE